MLRFGRPRTIAFFAVLGAGGCQAVLGLDDPIVDRGQLPDDAGDGDVSVLGPGVDGGQTDLDGARVDAPNVTINHHVDWDRPLYWNKVDLKTLNVGTTTFVGAVFDGKYIYFAPSNNTNDPTFAARFDTQAGGLTVTTAWRFFDTGLLHSDARGFEGAFFDGRFVYFVPYAAANGHVGRFARFDTKAQRDFTDPAAWSHFDVTAMNQYAKGFIGGVYDGSRYAYVAPGFGNFSSGGRPESVAAKFDTLADWASPQAWQWFDTQTVATTDAGGPRGFCGTVDTGSHVYFVPYGYAGSTRGRAVRFDRAKPFTSTSSWEAFDIQNVTPEGVGFQGGGFDGRYVYYSPLLTPTGTNGTITRFDTTKSFTETSSWSSFNLQTLDGGIAASQEDSGAIRAGYIGTSFDGRFMYFAPNLYQGAHHGWLARFDTSKPALEDPTAWSFYDLTKVDPLAAGMCGAVFDARYMYFVPCFTSTIIRFDALDAVGGPPPLPKLPHGGSFL